MVVLDMPFIYHPEHEGKGGIMDCTLSITYSPLTEQQDNGIYMYMYIHVDTCMCTYNHVYT